jgi:hypothetical protein
MQKGPTKMTRLTLDAATLAQLGKLDDLIEVANEDGITLGYFHPIAMTKPAPKLQLRSPCSDEEIQRRRQEKGGISLEEFWKRMGVK